MLLYLRLAWRNIWRHRRRTVIVVVAMGLGLSMMMMYDGLMDGSHKPSTATRSKCPGEIFRHAAGYSEKADSLPLLPLANDQMIIQTAKSIPNVIAVSRRINTGGLATNTEGAFSVTITGLEPEQESQISPIAQHVTSGSYLTSNDQDVVLIGKGLADLMNVQVGDKITLTGRSCISR